MTQNENSFIDGGNYHSRTIMRWFSNPFGCPLMAARVPVFLILAKK